MGLKEATTTFQRSIETPGGVESVALAHDRLGRPGDDALGLDQQRPAQAVEKSHLLPKIGRVTRLADLHVDT